MNEWIWVVKQYHVPNEPVQNKLLGQWIYKCKKENTYSAETTQTEEIQKEETN